MCFDYDWTPVASTESWPRARKEHRCCECGGSIAVGEQYQLSSQLADGEGWRTFKLCEACIYLLALLYAEEQAEGCAVHESWYPYGDGGMRQYARDRGWRGGVVEL